MEAAHVLACSQETDRHAWTRKLVRECICLRVRMLF